MSIGQGEQHGGRDRGHRQSITDDDQRKDDLQQGIGAVDEAAAVAVGHFPRGPGEVAVSPGRLQQGQVRLAEQTMSVQALEVVAAGLQIVAGGRQAARDRLLRIRRQPRSKGPRPRAAAVGRPGQWRPTPWRCAAAARANPCPAGPSGSSPRSAARHRRAAPPRTARRRPRAATVAPHRHDVDHPAGDVRQLHVEVLENLLELRHDRHHDEGDECPRPQPGRMQT